MVSDRVPEIPYSPPIEDLFANLGHNWNTLGPALWTLFGIIFGTYLIRKIMEHVKGD